jgi:hypothetical protein
MAKRRLKDLSCDAIDVESRSVDWSETPYEGMQERDDDRATWQAWEAQACDACGAVYVFSPGEGGEDHSVLVRDGRDSDREESDYDDARDKALNCTGHVSSVEGPMMNYFYPCDFRMSHEQAARAIVHLPLCVVELDGEKGLALTGGGMDLSWEICEAYLCLGMYPPATRRLPRMADTYTARKRWVVAGLRASLRIRANWTRQGLKDLRELVTWYEGRATAPNGAQARTKGGKA